VVAPTGVDRQLLDGPKYVRFVGEARYDRVADSYAIGPDDYSVPATRCLLQLTGRVAGLRVLDIACGHGIIAREMARRGARVVAIDVASGLLQRAHALEADDRLGVTYVQADASSATTLIGEHFDVAVCNFGLSDIDNLDGLCANVARLLVAGGRFVFSILHPCFPGVADVSSSWPTTGRYYDEGWWLAQGQLSALRREVGAHHRMISTYLNATTLNGLVLDAIEEPPPDEHWTERRPGTAALPVYVVVRCTRSAM
jgi:2-polyprenyl-3-methyl-5-hydroxy-6-metoxy-1,4-benzoquinol methylase